MTPPSEVRGRHSWRNLPGVVFGVAVLFALVVHVPGLFTPFTIDDFAHMKMIDGGYPSSHSIPFGLYDFIDDTNRDALLDTGIMPWWTHPHLVVRFLRPLSSLTLFADYRTFGAHPFWGHAHSLLWWAAAAIAVYVLLERSFSRRVARLGVIVFALAPCHVIPLAWLANREALVSTALGAFALVFYSRWRHERRPRDGLASTVLFALAMAAGEYSLCFAGYVLAIELVRRRESLGRRFTGISTFLVPSVVYLAARGALHYGARGGGMYHDPFWNFVGFARGVPRRFAVLLCTGWLGVDEFSLLLSSGVVLGATVVIAVLLLTLPVRRAFGGLNEPATADATWLLVGSILACIPMLAVEPSARLLGAPMIGIAAVVALVMDRAWFPPSPEPRGGPGELAALVAIALAFVHFVLAPLTTVQNTARMIDVASSIEKRMGWVRDHAAGRSTLVVMHAESLTTAIFAPCILDIPNDVRWRVLSYEGGRVLVLRTGERTLEFVGSYSPLFQMGPRQVFRDYDGSLHVGDRVVLDGMKATVLQLDKDGMPRRVRYEFDRPLDDPSILWLKETGEGFEEVPVPQKGQGEPIGP